MLSFFWIVNTSDEARIDHVSAIIPATLTKLLYRDVTC